MSKATARDDAEQTGHRTRGREGLGLSGGSAWIRRELDEGRGTDPARAVDLVVRLSSGRYDELSGRQLSVHDDLDEVLERIDDVRHRELYVLGRQNLGPRGQTGEVLKLVPPN